MFIFGGYQKDSTGRSHAFYRFVVDSYDSGYESGFVAKAYDDLHYVTPEGIRDYRHVWPDESSALKAAISVAARLGVHLGPIC